MKKISVFLKPKFKILACVSGILIIIFALVISDRIIQSDTANAQQSINLPILMYHGIIKDYKSQGQYVISPEEFESDLQYIQDQGYTTVTMTEVINYVYDDIPLPEKPIMLTFDDGYYNNYVYAFPLIKKYNCKMVLSPIAKCSETYSETPDTNVAYSHVTWDNIKEMVSSGLVEIQNHSYDLHTISSRRGAKKKKYENIEEYNKILKNDLTKAQQLFTEKVGVTPNTFTYPFGEYCSESTEVIKELGFKASFICEEKINCISKDIENLYNLGRFLRQGKISTADYFKSKNI